MGFLLQLIAFAGFAAAGYNIYLAIAKHRGMFMDGKTTLIVLGVSLLLGWIGGAISKRQQEIEDKTVYYRQRK